MPLAYDERESAILEACGSLGQIRLPEKIALESVGGPAFSNIILSNSSGFRKSREEWPRDLRKWKVAFVVRWQSKNPEQSESLALFRELVTTFKLMRGNSRYLRVKDWTDFEDWGKGRVEKRFGVARLVKDYENEFTGEKYTIPIFRPVPSTIVLCGGAVGGTVDYAVGTVSGIPDFDLAPDMATLGTWTGEYDVPAHFVEPEIQWQASAGGVLQWSGLTVMEQLLEEEDEVQCQ